MKYKILMMLQLLVLVIFCSCGVKPTEQDKTAGKASPLPTDSVESAVFNNSETTVKKKRLENDFIRIWRKSPARGVWITVQENLDGTDRQEFEEEFSGRELWLTNDWFYYHIPGPELDMDTVYRSPVRRENNDTTIDIKSRELLFRGADFDAENFIITDSYIIYGDYQDDANIYYHYDLKTKKDSKLFDMPDEGVIIEDSNTSLPMILNNSFFIGGTNKDKSIYRVSLDTLEKKTIVSDERKIHLDENEYYGYYLSHNHMTEYGGKVYFAPEGKKILKYDGESEKTSCVLDEKTLEKNMEAMNLVGNKGSEVQYEIDDVYIYRDKLYITVHVTWNQEELAKDGPLKGKMIVREYDRDILLSADLSDLKQWHLDETFSDYAWKHAKRSKGYRKDNGTYYCNELTIFFGFSDGKMLFAMIPVSDQGKEEYQAVIYDIATGTIEEIDDTDPRYYMFCATS